MKDTIEIDGTGASYTRMPLAKLREEFDALADRWVRETRNMSSPNAMERHPAYQQIIQMGPRVIPLILRRMDDEPNFWFTALLQLSGESEDPVKPAMHGDLEAMTNAWLRWGERRGHFTTTQNQNI
jgi:hypothetical protein